MSDITGSAGSPGVTAGKRVRRPLPVLPVLLILVFLVGGGNLLASWQQVQSFKDQLQQQQAAEQIAGAKELAALCTDLGTMARIPPPAGDPATNPARAYAQSEHQAWLGLFDGIRCGVSGHARSTTAASRQPGGP